MASKRDKLEARAKELGLSFVPETTDDELQQLINDFQNTEATEEQIADANNADTDTPEDDREFAPDTKFYRSTIPGLSVTYGDMPERDEQPTEVKFESFEEFNERSGNHYKVGYLATDEPDVIEVLEEDPNVEEISEDIYRQKTNRNNPKVKQVN